MVKQVASLPEEAVGGRQHPPLVDDDTAAEGHVGELDGHLPRPGVSDGLKTSDDPPLLLLLLLLLSHKNPLAS